MIHYAKEETETATTVQTTFLFMIMGSGLVEIVRVKRHAVKLVSCNEIKHNLARVRECFSFRPSLRFEFV